MSASLSEQSFQYVGILNGVMYRIDPLSGQSVEPMFGAQPFRKWADASGSALSAQIGAALPHLSMPLPTESVEPSIEVAALAEPVSVAREPSNLFPRNGAEPLRAGHPDLWALLVAGTCLEGSDYSAP